MNKYAENVKETRHASQNQAKFKAKHKEIKKEWSDRTYKGNDDEELKRGGEPRKIQIKRNQETIK